MIPEETIEERIYHVIKQAYDDHIKISDIVARLMEEVGIYSETSYYMTIHVFQKMMQGKRYTRRINMELTRYFIEHIGNDYGKEYLIRTLEATRENILYYYQYTQTKSVGFCKICQEICDDNGIEISFGDEIFESVEGYNNLLELDVPPENILSADVEPIAGDIQENHDGEEPIAYEKYAKENFLQEVFLDAEGYEEIVHLLKRKKNVILQGVPGVGKTFIAKRLAFSMMGEKDSNRVQMVQFHQNYSYEDFVLGYRPVRQGFELMEGPFYKFCKRAETDPDREYFFIIDEINRGNLSKIFGELLMLIENNKRGEEIRLLYEDFTMAVPPNIYMIGTMNTADRSLAMMDYALRRRFSFYELEPGFESKGFKKMAEKAGNEKYFQLVQMVKELNQEIEQDETLGKGFQIGHSFLCFEEPITDEWIKEVVKYELIPLLQEYWFDEEQKWKQWSQQLYGVIND